MEREILKFNYYEIGPILDEDALYNSLYEDQYNEDGDFVGTILESWNNFEIISTETEKFDLEDGYEIKNVIIRRKSDGKYFKGTYTFILYDENEYDTTLIEVFPVEKIITVYE